MKLIKGLEVKPFCRIIWVSAEAKENWSKYIPIISQLVQELELKSIDLNHRMCATITISPNMELNFAKKYPNLIFSPVRLTKKFTGFANRHVDPGPEDKDFYIHYVVSRSIDGINKFRDAYNAGDIDIQGEMLGFPECCRKFFDENWRKGYVDPIAQMINTGKVHPFSNPLLRYIGIRMGFHIPCSFYCTETIKIAEQRIALIEDKNLIKIFTALLSMPMQWDCYHGIAIIKTPIFWIITASNPAADRTIIDSPGSFMPREGKWDG